MGHQVLGSVPSHEPVLKDAWVDVQVSRWHEEVYDISAVVLTCPIEGLAPWLTKEFEDEYPPVTTHPQARCIWVTKPAGVALVFWFRPGIDTTDAHALGTIAHEALHGVLYVFEHVGIGGGEHSEEAFTYYLAYWVREIIERLRAMR